MIASDNVLDFSLAKFIDYAKFKQTSCIMRYYELNDEKLKKCGLVTIDENDLILNTTEKFPTSAIH